MKRQSSGGRTKIYSSFGWSEITQIDHWKYGIFMQRDLFYTPINCMWIIDYKSTITKKRMSEYLSFFHLEKLWFTYRCLQLLRLYWVITNVETGGIYLQTIISR